MENRMQDHQPDPQEDVILQTLGRLNTLSFMQAADLTARVAVVQRAAPQRLGGHHLAEVWADVLSAQAATCGASRVEQLLREMLVLSPEHDRAEALYEALMQPRQPLADPAEPVFLVMGAAHAPERALALQASLTQHGALAWTAWGGAPVGGPDWHEHGVSVAVPEAAGHESAKLAQAVAAVLQRHGLCHVVVLSDTSTLSAQFDPQAFGRLASQHAYVGVAESDAFLSPAGGGVASGSLHGRRGPAAWAQGACFLLNAGACDEVAREAVMYPGQWLADPLPERAMASFMQSLGVDLQALSSHALWGVKASSAPRPEPVPASLPVPVPVPVPFAEAHSPVSEPKQLALGSEVEPRAVATARSTRIPKILHVIWVGDESKRPDNCIQTWVDLNPEWTVKVWGNEDLDNEAWVNARHMRAMWNKELNGVADLMRWEILYNEGGVVVDADSVCVRPLDDWLLEADAIACWENEICRPRLIACGFMGAVPGNAFIGQIVQDLSQRATVTDEMAWQTVGPLCLTTAYFKYRYTGLTILPSHFFIPDHFSGLHYEGSGVVYAKQEWASTHGSYDTLHLKQVA
jgi:mannosyltransferase OCH1-like enzyme